MISRREFLGKLSLGAGLLAGAQCFPTPGIAALVSRLGSKGKPEDLLGGTYLLAETTRLQLIDLQSKKTKILQLPNTGCHGLAFSPEDPALCAVIDQNAPIVSLWNLREWKQVAVIRAKDGFLFSGHGSFSTDGKSLFLPEFPEGFRENGFVSFISTKNWKREGWFASGGAQTHVIQKIKGGKVLAVGHYGKVGGKDEPFRDGVLSFMDSSSGKILETINSPDARHSLCHMDSTAEDDLVISTRAWVLKGKTESGGLIEDHYSTPIAFGKMGAVKNWRFENPAALSEKFRLNLTVKMDRKRNLAFITHVKGNLVSLWNTKGELVKSSAVDFGPLGASMNHDQSIYLTNTVKGELCFLEPESLDLVGKLSLAELGIKPGPHGEFLSQKFVS